ncbi:MAG: carbohydrate binding family 9 domain-containing protein [Acidimicrobiia bacterium]|nr:carbohydrate binding family 9 domain-containing protein [Acidimicrobiia bacterium]
MRLRLLAAWWLGAVLTAPAPAAAQDTVAAAAPARVLVAVRLSTPLAVDGRLDEPIYTTAPPTGGFTMQEPVDGGEPTEPTDVWVFFDDENVYVAIRCWDSEPGRVIANEMRRDGNLMQNDNVVVTFDTFHDRRTGFYFQTNPVGALRDQQINDERNANVDWNTVWDSRSQQDHRGWTVEMVIPFKSLRYPAGAAQSWGINFRRIVRWKNETSFFAPVPASFSTRGAFAVSFSATLAGLVAPESSSALELKPYVKSSVDTNRRAVPVQSNDPSAGVGLDVKYGLTKGLIADVTVNTDFAQVESDEDQVNLTRATLFFPEKRDFFLEGQGIFGFGGAQQGIPGQSGLGPILENGNASSLIPSLFFSRRIGLSGGQVVPIRAGGRVAGRAGLYAIGALNIQTGDAEGVGEPATNFTVVRVRRDILERSSIGMMTTSRSSGLAGTGSNRTFGVDTSLRFGEALTVTSYYAASRTPGITRDDRSYLAKLDYAADRYGVNVEHLSVGEGFRPDIGLLRRAAFKRTYGYARFSPRPHSLPAIRKMAWEASVDYLADRNGRLQSREETLGFRMDLSSGDQLNADYRGSYEFLARPLSVGPDVQIAPGEYRFHNAHVLYYLGPQRRVSGRFSLDHGSFYDGTKTSFAMTSRVDFGPKLGVEPRVTIDRVRLTHTAFTSRLLGGRVSFTASPRLSFASLVQYNSNTRSLSSNLRFRWEYIPGSDLFVVYTDNRDTTPAGFPQLDNRSFAVKLTRLLRR